MVYGNLGEYSIRDQQDARQIADANTVRYDNEHGSDKHPRELGQHGCNAVAESFR